MRKIISVITNIIEKYDIGVLALKKLSPFIYSERLFAMQEKIRKYAQKRKMKVESYSIDELKKSLIHAGRMNKNTLAEVIADEHTELSLELYKEQLNKNPYYLKMFEAIALTMVCNKKRNSSL